MSNNIEYEVKILNINISDVITLLEKAGAKKIKSIMQKRYVFDVIPAKKGTWLRLRTNGSKTTLALKQISNSSIDGTQEWETIVDNFETTHAILTKAGFKAKGYQENRRTDFALGEVEISIDEWPKLNPYIEIEGPTETHVEKVVQLLGYTEKDLSFKNTIDLYSDIGIDLDKVERLDFTD